MRYRGVFLLLLFLIVSGCTTGKEGIEANTNERMGENRKAETEKKTKNYNAYEAAKNHITVFFGQGNPDAINHGLYENSTIVKRDDGFYYITSTFHVQSSNGISTYNYEMLLDSNYEILDAYVPGSIGVFDRPMVFDRLGQSAITNIRGNNERQTFADHNQGETESSDTETETNMQEFGEQTEEEFQEIAYKVQEYVVNMVNDLTIIENMSSDLQTITSDSSIYPDEILGGRTTIVQNFEEHADLMIKACNDIMEFEVPQNTEYLVLAPQLKKYAEQYLSVVQEMKAEIMDKNSDKLNPLKRNLQTLDSEIIEIEKSFGNSIGANNYSEYNALLSVWKEDKLHQSGNATHVTLARGIDFGLRDYELDFRSDINN